MSNLPHPRYSLKRALNHHLATHGDYATLEFWTNSILTWRIQQMQLNEENLVRLRDYVATEVTPEEFDMVAYRSEPSAIVAESRREYFDMCGTVGCLAGLIIHALPEIELGEKWTWSSLVHTHLGIDLNREVGDFLFCGCWADYPQYNTPQAAVRRIDILLKLGYERVKERMDKRFSGDNTLESILKELETEMGDSK